MPDASAPHAEPAQRRRWMGVLARAARGDLEAAWQGLDARPAYTHVRRPETGLVLVRGRAGGTGAAFNLGEMTMTRCAVRVETPARRVVGLSFVAGRDIRHAELAAVFDALLQDPARHAEIEAAVIGPIEGRLNAARRERAAEIAATKVDFFTLVREQGA
ncbi:MAG TPA: phosphonate C-P lyase system protein PhnG [Alphaproteobacteria bacterium]|nr:phosphonate C-P lyase system protein PhnG [Alphaproteobacteria bacterium]